MSSLYSILRRLSRASTRSEVWEIEVWHDGLNKYRLIRGKDKYVVEQKAAAQCAVWDEMWERRLEKDQRLYEKEQQIKDTQSKIELAEEKTRETQEEIEKIEYILRHALDKNRKIDREILKKEIKFHKEKPPSPKLLDIPKPPDKNARFYQPKIGFWDEIFLREQEKIACAENMFKSDYDCWLGENKEIVLKNKKLEKAYQDKLSKWQTEEREYLATQKKKNAIYKQYFDKQPNAVIPYYEVILSDSEYPDYFPQEFDLDYNPDTKILIVDYSLPSVEDIPKLKEVKYVKSRDESVEIFLSESEVNKLYDNLIYQITLRTIHEIYESDVITDVHPSKNT